MDDPMYRYGDPHGSAQPDLLQFDVTYPERLSRLLIFVKWLLVIPHAVVVGVLGWAASIVTFIAWFAILFTGRYPASLWSFSARVLAWNARVAAYYGLMRDEYPPFSLDASDYPVRFELHRPERQSRLLIFVKWLLVIPHYVMLWLLSFVMIFVYVISWFAILMLGRYPRGLFNYTVGFYRWYFRVLAYLWLLTDTYPPFGMDGDRPSGTYAPTSPYAPAGGYAAPTYGAAYQAGPYGD